MSQFQPVTVTGLKMSKGEFTPLDGKNKGIPQPYDNLNIYAQVPFPEADMESKGFHEQQYKLKGSGNYYRFNQVVLPCEADLEFEFDFTRSPPKPVLKDIHFKAIGVINNENIDKTLDKPKA